MANKALAIDSIHLHWAASNFHRSIMVPALYTLDFTSQAGILMHILRYRCFFFSLGAIIAFKHFAFALSRLLLFSHQDESRLEHSLLSAGESVGVPGIVLHSKFTHYKDSPNEDRKGESRRREFSIRYLLGILS